MYNFRTMNAIFNDHQCLLLFVYRAVLLYFHRRSWYEMGTFSNLNLLIVPELVEIDKLDTSQSIELF